MIIDVLDNLQLYLEVNTNFKSVVEYINQTDINSLETGKYEISDNAFVIVQEYNTKKLEDAKPEAHKKYIDIQMVLQGEEKMGYASLSDTKPFSFYDDKKDIEFLSGNVDFIHAKSGMFFIFFPQDAHMPGIAIDESKVVKKAVFKVKVN